MPQKGTLTEGEVISLVPLVKMTISILTAVCGTVDHRLFRGIVMPHFKKVVVGI